MRCAWSASEAAFADVDWPLAFGRLALFLLSVYASSEAVAAFAKGEFGSATTVASTIILFAYARFPVGTAVASVIERAANLTA